MEKDSKFTRDDEGYISVRVVNETEDLTAVTDKDYVFARDKNGNIAIRVVNGAGGNGHFLGGFATPQALAEAYPTAEPGDFAIVESTDTVWVWDNDEGQWIDSDRKGQVTSVNGQTGAVTVQETLVNQSNIKSVNGNSLLGSGNLELTASLAFPSGWTTNSTTKAFCDDVAADSSAVVGKMYIGEVTFSDLPASISNSEVEVKIMDGSTAQTKVIVLELTSGNVAPYKWQYTYWNGGSNVSGWIGFQQELTAGTNITITGTTISATDTTYSVMTGASAGAAGTSGLVPAPAAGDEDKCLKGDGTWGSVDSLPSQTGNAGKVLKTNGTTASWESTTTSPATMPVLLAANWSNKEQTVSVTGVTADNVVYVSPAPMSTEEYGQCGVYAYAQAAGTLTFKCEDVPTNDLTVNIIIM